MFVESFPAGCSRHDAQRLGYNNDHGGGHTNAVREKNSETTRVQVGEPRDIVDFTIDDNPL